MHDAGTIAVDLAIAAVISPYIGHRSVLLAFAHQAVGVFGHIWFCRRPGVTAR